MPADATIRKALTDAVLQGPLDANEQVIANLGGELGKEGQYQSIASSGTLDLEDATGQLVDITGTATINSITLSPGHVRMVRFQGVLTLTYSSSLVLPTGASITTAAGDVAEFAGYAGAVVRCVSYQRADGTPLVGGGGAVSSVNTRVGAVVLTAADVGLGNVTNTSDANKPVSTAQQTALNLKANTSSLGTAAALNVGTSANQIVQLDGSAKLPPVDGSQLTGLPAGSLPFTLGAGQSFLENGTGVAIALDSDSAAGGNVSIQGYDSTGSPQDIIDFDSSGKASVNGINIQTKDGTLQPAIGGVGFLVAQNAGPATGTVNNYGTFSAAVAAAGLSMISDGTYAISNSLGGSVVIASGLITSWTPAP